MTLGSSGGIENPVKQLLSQGRVALGMNVRLSRSADIARVARGTGHDFLFIDTQHSLFGLETIGHIAQTALAIGIAPIVRVRGVDDPDVSLLLDNGVSGIVFPDVGSADDARRAVKRVRFPPDGDRSVSGGYPQFDYAPVPQGQALPALNAATLVVCMVETIEGVESIEEIAAVKGVDVVHVGTHDLLQALGKPGQFDAPEVRETYERTIAATAANGTHAGVGGNRDVERQLGAIRMGMRFVTTQSDIGFLFGAAREWTGAIRSGLKDL